MLDAVADTVVPLLCRGERLSWSVESSLLPFPDTLSILPSNFLFLLLFHLFLFLAWKTDPLPLFVLSS